MIRGDIAVCLFAMFQDFPVIHYRILFINIQVRPTDRRQQIQHIVAMSYGVRWEDDGTECGMLRIVDSVAENEDSSISGSLRFQGFGVAGGEGIWQGTADTGICAFRAGKTRQGARDMGIRAFHDKNSWQGMQDGERTTFRDMALWQRTTGVRPMAFRDEAVRQGMKTRGAYAFRAMRARRNGTFLRPRTGVIMVGGEH
ncbi:hypothetical protein CSQ87_10405 [Bifidobacterium simiarum]|uniref:Uncharacterized protein n=1 Tax=Bifidobacterium simiarum TaxID=2045441 RepID=A0A2M9HC76_9BIFI|nr:hypothetical protein CSQ87_10405 [Bifidobacterium simiarum]